MAGLLLEAVHITNDAECITEVARMVCSLVWHTEQSGYEPPIPEIEQYREQTSPVETHLLVREDGQLLALAGILPIGRRRMHITEIAVDPDARGRHIGEALIRRIATAALRQHRQLTTTAKNRSFFEHFGFKPVRGTETQMYASPKWVLARCKL